MSTLDFSTFEYDPSAEDGSFIGKGTDGCSYRITGVGSSAFYAPHTYVEQALDFKEDNETEKAVTPFLSQMIEDFALQAGMEPCDVRLMQF